MVGGAGVRLVGLCGYGRWLPRAGAAAASHRPGYAYLVVAVAGADRPAAVQRGPAARSGEIAAATGHAPPDRARARDGDRKSTRLNSSHVKISYAVFCLQRK